MTGYSFFKVVKKTHEEINQRTASSNESCKMELTDIDKYHYSEELKYYLHVL